MLLEKYRQKRNFRQTKEPRGKRVQDSGFSYVIQKHAARNLHYDFRLELNGVLLSWAVPKGPSLDPKVKRLAMHVEDHPVDYGSFEGTIPKGQYGGGTVMVWDRGTWEPEGDPEEAYSKGRMTFTLHGDRLHGKWHLVRSHGAGADGDRRWLLFKGTDAAAETGDTLLEDEPRSAATGRTMDEIAKSDRTWQSNRNGKASRNGKKNGNVEKSARKASASPRATTRSRSSRARAVPSKDPMPATMDVELAQLVKEAPAGDGWLHEVKLDGYRIVARRSGKDVALVTRGGKDWTERMPVVRDAVLALPVASVILDGEVVVLDSRGISNFQLLQNSMGDGSAKALVYVVFDLLYLNGADIRHLALEQRKELLEKLLERGASDHLRLSEHVETSGPAFLAEACKRKLEGIVSKRASEPYRGGRGHGWVKTKCLGRQEFVIGGYTNPGGSRSHLGALLVGVPDTNGKGTLRYAGKVGTGFTERSLKELKSRLSPLEQGAPSFANPPRGAAARAAHWVKPVLLAEIEFTEVTNDGLLRHPTFRGLREDKPALEVKMEKPASEPAEARRPKAASGAKSANTDPDFRLTNPDKILYPESGYTKADIAKYYATIAGHMFPHLEDRPLTLVRCPEGRGKACFFQKHAPADVGPGLRGIPIDAAGKELYIAMDSPMGLLSLTQLGVLEIHTWGSHTRTLEKPDLLVFDLDPDPTVEWAKVVETAKALRTRLAALELESWVKTTGGKGLHVCVPIRPRLGWEEVKGFCRGVAEAMVKEAPDAYVATASKAKRRGKIFVDYLRNGRGATFIAPYSTRAREGAPVATPVAWSELTARLRPEAFTIETVPARMKKLKKDPWSGIGKCDQELTAKAMEAVRN